MEHFEILIWIMTSGFGITFGIMIFMWKNLTSMILNLDRKVEKLDEKVMDIDRRLCRLEGAFSSKEFCAIRTQENNSKAE